MAVQQPNKILVQLDFIANKPSLTSIQNQLKQVLTQIDTQGLKLNLDKGSIDTIKAQVNTLSETIAKNFNKNTNKIDLAKVRQQLEQAGINVLHLDNQLKQFGINGTNSFNNVARAGYVFEQRVKQTNKLVQSLGVTLANTLKWHVSTTVLNSFAGSIQKAYYFAKDLDRSLNDIRIVAGSTADEMIRFSKEANNAAKVLAASTTEYTDAALVYFQQGMGAEDVRKMTEATLIGANIAGESTVEMSNLLTSTINGYKLAASDAMMVTDKLAAVGAKTAADFFELATGMSKVASMANAAGISMDELNAQLATIVSVTKEAPESIGTSLKTIYGRMLAFKNNATTMMEDEDGEMFGAPAVESALEKLSIATGKNISLFTTLSDGSKQLRDLGSVINEIGDAWQNTSDNAVKFGLATALAGSRQQNRLVALFDSWEMYRESVETSMNAEGTALKQQEVYLDSYDSKLKQMQTSAESLYMQLFSAQDLKPFVSALTWGIEQVQKFAENLGEIPGILAVILTYLSNSVMQKPLANLASFFTNRAINRNAEININDKYADVTKDEIRYDSKIKQMAGTFSAEEVENVKKMTKNLLDSKKAYVDLEDSLKSFEQSSINTNNQLKILSNTFVKNGSDFKTFKTNLSSVETAFKNVSNPTRKMMTEFKNLSIITEKTFDSDKMTGSLNTFKNKVEDLLKAQSIAIESEISTTGQRVSLESQRIKSAQDDLDARINSSIKSANLLKGTMEGVSIGIAILSSSMKTATDQTATWGDMFKSLGGSALAMSPMIISSIGSIITAAKTAGATLASVAGSAGGIGLIIAAAAAGISLIVKAFSDAKVSAEEAALEFDKVKNSIENLKSQQSTVESLEKEFESLSKKINKTKEETDRYYDIQNQLADIFPDLVLYIDKNGNSILDLSDDYSKLNDTMADYIENEEKTFAKTAIDRLKTLREELKNYKNELTFAKAMLTSNEFGFLNADKEGLTQRQRNTITASSKNLTEKEIKKYSQDAEDYAKKLELSNKELEKTAEYILYTQDNYRDLNVAAMEYAKIALQNRLADEEFDPESDTGISEMQEMIFAAAKEAENFSTNVESWGEAGSFNLRIYKILFNEIKTGFANAAGDISKFNKEIAENGKLSQESILFLIENYDLTSDQIRDLNRGDKIALSVLKEIIEKRKEELLLRAQELEYQKSALEYQIKMNSADPQRVESTNKMKDSLEEVDKQLSLIMTTLGLYNEETKNAANNVDDLGSAQSKTSGEYLSSLKNIVSLRESVAKGEELSKFQLLDLLAEYPEYNKAILEAEGSKEKQIELTKILFEEDKKRLIETKEAELLLAKIRIGNQSASVAELQSQIALMESTRDSMSNQADRDNLQKAIDYLKSENREFTAITEQLKVLREMSMDDVINPFSESSKDSSSKSYEWISKNKVALEGLNRELEKVKAAQSLIDSDNFEAQNESIKTQQKLLHETNTLLRKDLADIFNQLGSGFDIKEIFTFIGEDIYDISQEGYAQLFSWIEAEKERLSKSSKEADKLKLQSINELSNALLETTDTVKENSNAWLENDKTLKSNAANYKIENLETQNNKILGIIESLEDLEKISKDIDEQDFDKRTAVLEEQMRLTQDLSEEISDDLKGSVVDLAELLEDTESADILKFFGISNDGVVRAWKDLEGFLNFIDSKIEHYNNLGTEIGKKTVEALQTFKSQTLEEMKKLESQVDSLLQQQKELDNILEDATDAHEEAVKALTDAQEALVDAQENLLDVEQAYRDAIDDYGQEVNDGLKARADLEQEYYDTVNAYADEIEKAIRSKAEIEQELLQKQIESLKEKNQLILETELQPNIDKAQEELDIYKEKIAAQEKINELAEIEAEIEKAKLNILNVQKERNVRILNENNEWEWIADPKALEDVFENLQTAEDKKEKYLQDEEVDRLEALVKYHQDIADLAKQSADAEIKILEDKIKENQRLTDEAIKTLTRLEDASYEERLNALVNNYNDIEGLEKERFLTRIARLEAQFEMIGTLEGDNHKDRMYYYEDALYELENLENLSYAERLVAYTTFTDAHNLQTSKVLASAEAVKIAYNEIGAAEDMITAAQDEIDANQLLVDAALENLKIAKLEVERIRNEITSILAQINSMVNADIKLPTISGNPNVTNTESGQASIENGYTQDYSAQNAAAMAAGDYATALKTNIQANIERGLGPVVTQTSLISSGKVTQEEADELIKLLSDTSKHATGTNSTKRGLFLDGEIGPELRWSAGNEAILPSDLSAQLLQLPKTINDFFSSKILSKISMDGLSKTDQTNFYLSNVTVRADSPDDFIKEMRSIANIGFTR